MVDAQTVVNLGTGGSVLNAQLGSSSGADSNDPKYLDWSGENYVYLPGVAGNYLSVPDEAALDITGDIDIRVQVAMDDWTPATQTTLMSKASSGQLSFQWDLRTNGEMRFYWSTDGSTFTSEESDAVLGFDDGEVKWVRVTLDVDNGAGGYEVKFYTSDDGTTWSQSGSTDTGGSTTSIYSGSAAVTIGGLFTVGSLSAKVYRAQILDGIGGTTVLDVDCSQITSGSATTFGALTGQTVTINRSTSGRKSVAVTHPCWLFGTDDYMQVADNALLDFDVNEPFTVLAVVRQWNDGVYQAIVYKADGSTGYPGWRLYLNASTRYQTYFRDDDAVIEVTQITRVAPVSKVYVVSTRNDPAADVIRLDNQDGSNFANADFTGTTFANSVPLRIGSNSTAVNLTADMELLAVAVFRRLLTNTELAALTTYYESRWS